MMAAHIPGMTSRNDATGGAVQWQWARLDELTPARLYAVMVLRQRVFVVEQACVFQDADGRDADAWHLLGWMASAARDGDGAGDGAGRPMLAAYARVFSPGARYAAASVGRIVTAPEARGAGLGRALVSESLRRVDAAWPGTDVWIEAQQRLERFYEAYGFRRGDEEPYVEDGIVHVKMVRAAR